MARYILTHDQRFNVATTNATAGTAKPAGRFQLKYLQISGTFAGGWSIQLQGSVDGTNWLNIGAAIIATPTALVSVPESWQYLRVLTNTAGTISAAATPAVVLGAYDERGD